MPIPRRFYIEPEEFFGPDYVPPRSMPELFSPPSINLDPGFELSPKEFDRRFPGMRRKAPTPKDLEGQRGSLREWMAQQGGGAVEEPVVNEMDFLSPLSALGIGGVVKKLAPRWMQILQRRGFVPDEYMPDMYTPGAGTEFFRRPRDASTAAVTRGYPERAGTWAMEVPPLRQEDLPGTVMSGQHGLSELEDLLLARKKGPKGKGVPAYELTYDPARQQYTRTSEPATRESRSSAAASMLGRKETIRSTEFHARRARQVLKERGFQQTADPQSGNEIWVRGDDWIEITRDRYVGKYGGRSFDAGALSRLPAWLSGKR